MRRARASRAKETFDRFQKDVTEHAVEILHADGVRRHIRCRRQNSYVYGFDIVTWPGYLAFTGDMGCYVFTRLDDMFEFFRGRSAQIDFSYWAEKAVAVDKTSGIKAFDGELFKEQIRRHFRESTWFERATLAERKSCWQSIKDEVLSEVDNSEDEARAAASRFSYGDWRQRKSGESFQFHDFWETNTDEYTYRFLWCCFALRWAIEQYDRIRHEQQITPI